MLLMKREVSILTGHSHSGGSTIALANLCKEFNARGIPCKMYGPHSWHAKFGENHRSIYEYRPKPIDNLICHFIEIPKVDCRKIIYSCHEMWWFNFEKMPKYYHKVQFLTQKQADYHNSVTDYVLIPNVKEEIKVTRDESATNVAGIIGSIEERKNTAESIKRALDDGCDKVILFGHIEPDYFQREVLPLMSNKIVMHGYATKEEMYSMIDRVYHMSNGEVASLVKDECYTTDTLFFGNEHTDNEVSTLTNDQIIDLWVEELEL